ncbi:MAG: hypothetical protein ABJA67_11335 [Chthonomonadales bacterium]
MKGPSFLVRNKGLLLAIPIGAAVFAVTYCGWQVLQVRHLEFERNVMQSNIDKYVNIVSTNSAYVPGQFPMAAQSPHERSVFEGNLRMVAAADQVEIVAWRDVFVPANQQDMADPSEPPKPKPIQVYDPIINNITIKGSDQAISHFLSDIIQMPRMVNIADAEVAKRKGAKSGVVTASLTTIRYVANYTIAPDEKPIGPSLLNRAAAAPIKTALTPVNSARITPSLGQKRPI